MNTSKTHSVDWLVIKSGVIQELIYVKMKEKMSSLMKS